MRTRCGFGRVHLVTSYTSTDDTEIANQVEFTYTSLWQMDTIAQSPDGEIEGSNRLAKTVQYEYAQSYPNLGGDNYSRVTRLNYPEPPLSTANPARVVFEYDGLSGANSKISRPSILSLVTKVEIEEEEVEVLVPFAEYQHTGLGMFAVVNYPTVSINPLEEHGGVQLDRTLQYEPDGPAPVGSRRFFSDRLEDDLRGIYPGWDRFGRTKAQAWVDGGLTVHATPGNFPDRPPVVLETYTYDVASNPLTRFDSRPGAHLADRDFQFTYDQLDRLTESSRGTALTWDAKGTQDWTLDMLGNWDKFRWDKNGDGDFLDGSETDVREHNFANEIDDRTLEYPSPAPNAGVPVTYDKAGNVLIRYENAFLRMELTHDAWNRLVRVQRITGNIEDPPLDVSEHEYNGLHWRVVSRADTDSPPDGELDERRGYFYSASWQVLEEFVQSDFDSVSDAEDEIEADHRIQQFWGLRHIDDAVMLRRQANASGGEIERTSFQLTDRQFSVVAVLDETGALLERVTYDPYGRAQHRWPGDFNGDGYADSTDTGGMALFYPIDDPGYRADEDLDRNGYTDIDDLIIAASVWSGRGPLGSGQISDPEGPANRVGFAGYRFEPSSSLYHVRFRWYDTGLGRWAERDPAGYVDGSSLYSYVQSTPLRWVDTHGLCKVEVRYNKLTPLYSHAYVVVTDKRGKEHYFRGGPSADGPSSGNSGAVTSGGGGSSGGASSGGSGSGSSNSTSPGCGDAHGRSKGPWGPITTEYGDYTEGTIDWNPDSPSSDTVLDDDAPCDELLKKLQNGADDINNSGVPYNPFGPNSNSTARELLEGVGLTPPDPSEYVPGWTTPIESGREYQARLRLEDEAHRRQKRESERRSGGGYVCFTAGTMIRLSNGEFVDIATLEEGATLLAFRTRDSTIQSVTVSRFFRAQSTELYRIALEAETLEVTAEHPFLVHERGWVMARDLKSVHSLVTIDGDCAKVLRVEHVILDHPVDVFALSVSAPNTYAVGRTGVVVHNK